MSSNHVEIEFGVDDRDALLARMAELATAHRGWVNVQPVVEGRPGAARRGSILGWFSSLNGRVPDLPLGTWLAPELKGDEVLPAQVGVQHPSGHKTLPLLRELGLVPPEGWRLTQDAGRRGLVVRAPAEAPLAEVLDWLAQVTAALTPVPTTGRWVARVYPGR